MVPKGARLADIGSDHAYLPIALCLENKIQNALASDINEGPVAAAVANIQKNGLSDRIIAVRADGLDQTRDFQILVKPHKLLRDGVLQGLACDFFIVRIRIRLPAAVAARKQFWTGKRKR